jgi:hypothetical protein
MRKYHKTNLGDYRISDDIEFSESMTPREFNATYGQAWDDGRYVGFGTSEMQYVTEIDGRFVITGLNDGRVDCWAATIFVDIEGYVWEADSHEEDD